MFAKMMSRFRQPNMKINGHAGRFVHRHQCIRCEVIDNRCRKTPMKTSAAIQILRFHHKLGQTTTVTAANNFYLRNGIKISKYDWECSKVDAHVS